MLARRSTIIKNCKATITISHPFCKTPNSQSSAPSRSFYEPNQTHLISVSPFCGRRRTYSKTWHDNTRAKGQSFSLVKFRRFDLRPDDDDGRQSDDHLSSGSKAKTMGPAVRVNEWVDFGTRQTLNEAINFRSVKMWVPTCCWRHLVIRIELFSIQRLDHLVVGRRGVIIEKVWKRNTIITTYRWLAASKKRTPLMERKSTLHSKGFWMDGPRG